MRTVLQRAAVIQAMDYIAYSPVWTQRHVKDPLYQLSCANTLGIASQSAITTNAFFDFLSPMLSAGALHVARVCAPVIWRLVLKFHIRQA